MGTLTATGGHPVLTTLLVLAAVLVLAALRAWTWRRKERVLRRVGLDLRVPDASDKSPQKPR
ncbi:hypothetical protein D9V37_17525 [Nocardioides mangrovicus]|uniref:Uncharacterized protein n=1 Tax=Nocardioides mangrovicus TaxID=2478913 RepID=A0A3L8NZ32_9ACTN|nr:hypothetical protein [Nocardioides mangrovicus]RLV47912.1 hypothetical protein D9V37_17525 [Nocardioides mangrovicus]